MANGVKRGRRALMAAAILACGGGEKPAPGVPADRPGAQADSSAVPVAAAPGAPAICPMFAPWQACSVEERIYRSGLPVTRRAEGVRHDFMRVEGIVFETPRAEVQVFLYASDAERRRDTDQLDTMFVAPKGKRVSWRSPATLVTSQNLAAIILSPNPRQSERIALALGAGLPLPPK